LATTTSNPAAFSRPAHEYEENYQHVTKSTCLLGDFYRLVSLDDGNSHASAASARGGSQRMNCVAEGLATSLLISNSTYLQRGTTPGPEG
jgi:hypothetical protein